MGREYGDPALRDQPGHGALEVSHHVRGLAVSVRGEHDLSAAPRLTRALAEAAAHSSVLVDLSECSFIDSTVIEALLLHTAKTVRAGGEHFALVIPPEQRNAIRMAELIRRADSLAVYPSRAAALASLEQAVQQDAGSERA